MDEDIIIKLFEINAISFGEFKLKSGLISPVYFNLRVIIGYPDLLRKISDLLYQVASAAGAQYEIICGVPYTALPLATCISLKHNKPMVIRRKEAKDYGTRQMIEGVYETNQTCLVVEDVVTSGGSVLETVEELKHADIVTKDAVVLLDRGQGGKERLKNCGINLHCVLHIEQVLNVLLERNAITQRIYNDVHTFLNENRFSPSNVTSEEQFPNLEPLSYKDRVDLVSNPIAKKILEIIIRKKSNLAFSVDVTTSDEILRLTKLVGPHICILKTHIDIVSDFSNEFIKSLLELSRKHDFVIFEDRKFADIGNTVVKQYSDGIYHIKDWAEVTNAHSIPGDGVIKGLKASAKDVSRGCLIIAEMSVKGALTDDKYKKASVKIAEENSDFVIGFISTSRVTTNPRFIHMTPGVNLKTSLDQLGQQYLTPEEVITNRFCDIIIVGRGIYSASKPEEAAIQYKEAAYQAYLNRASNN